MTGYRELEIYQIAFDLAIQVHHASCDETNSQLETIINLYPEITEFFGLKEDYENLGGKINKYISYVDNNWRT